MIERVFVHIKTRCHNVCTGNRRFDDLATIPHGGDEYLGFEIIIAVDADDLADEMRNLFTVRFFPTDERRHVRRAEPRGLERLRRREHECEIHTNATIGQPPQCFEPGFGRRNFDDKVLGERGEFRRLFDHHIWIGVMRIHFDRKCFGRSFQHPSNFFDHNQERFAAVAHMARIARHAVNVPHV